jgi:hypothetical protein
MTQELRSSRPVLRVDIEALQEGILAIVYLF